MKSLDIVTIATNHYVEHWKRMVESADRCLIGPCRVTMNVFTDNPEECLYLKSTVSNIDVKVFKIESLKWPEATLMRYEIFRKFSDELNSEFIMHLDADMLIHENFITLLEKTIMKHPISLVAHPGYFRPRKLKKLKLYFCHPQILMRDVKRYATMGGIGSWETSEKSKAYVPRDKRRSYVCGGTWLGKSSAVKKLFVQLSNEVESDYKNGVMATWHDESHLNNWASRNEFNLLSPSYCSDPSYPQLVGTPIYIEAVDKGR